MCLMQSSLKCNYEVESWEVIDHLLDGGVIVVLEVESSVDEVREPPR